MKKMTNQLTYLIEKNNIPPLPKEYEHGLLYSSDEELQQTLINLLKP